MGCPFHRPHSRSLWKRFSNLFRFLRKEKQSFASNLGVLSGENLAVILDAAVDSIITINEDGILLSFNRAAERTFGFSKEDVIGKNVNILMPEPFRSQHNTYIQNYVKTGINHILGIGREIIAQKKDGSIFPVYLAVSEVFTGYGRLFTGIIRDLTEEVKTKNTLNTIHRMEGEIAAKNEYISILSHELRTPLTGIYGSLSLLHKDSGLSKKHHEFIGIAFRNAERLMRIINEVLDISKIEKGVLKLELNPMNICSVVLEAVTASSLLATHLDVELVAQNLECEIIVLGDYTRLIQVMMNLLSNAIKFSPPHSKVFVSIESTRDRVRVVVKDCGKGIPLEFHKKMFLPFSQAATNEARIVGGTGLGLHICKSIISRLNGTIDFTTQENQGTTLFFELPIYKGTI